MPLEQPLLPLRLLKNVPYVAIVVVASAGQMVFTSLSILWPEQIEFLYSTNNIQIGWMAITSGLCLAVAEIVIGPLLRVMGHARLQLIVATVLLMAFLGGLAGTTQRTEAMAIAFTSLVGFTSGWLDVISLVSNGLVTDPADLGLANGFMGSVKQTIGAVSCEFLLKGVKETRRQKTKKYHTMNAKLKPSSPPHQYPSLWPFCSPASQQTCQRT